MSSMWIENLLKRAIMIINSQIIDQWIFCAPQKPYLLILANLQSNKRQKKKCYDFHINISPTCISLNVKFSISTKTLENFSDFLASLINYLGSLEIKVFSFSLEIPTFGFLCISWATELRWPLRSSRNLGSDPAMSIYVADRKTTKYYPAFELKKEHYWCFVNVFFKQMCKVKEIKWGSSGKIATLD